MRSLTRYVATLVLATNLAVMGGCGAAATAGKDNSPGTSPKLASSTGSTAGSSSQGGLPQGSESVKLDPADFSRGALLATSIPSTSIPKEGSRSFPL
jgi:hypothetical protein